MTTIAVPRLQRPSGPLPELDGDLSFVEIETIASAPWIQSMLLGFAPEFEQMFGIHSNSLPNSLLGLGPSDILAAPTEIERVMGESF
jgi:hypothetical protein